MESSILNTCCEMRAQFSQHGGYCEWFPNLRIAINLLAAHAFF